MWETTSLVSKAEAMVVLSAGVVDLLRSDMCGVLYPVAYLGTKKDKLLYVVPKRVTNKRWVPFTYTNNIWFHSG